ncbi:MAG: outer membrane beta-barrel protein, partial [Pirellulales bacterium]
AATTTLAQSGLQQPYLVTPGDSGSTPWSAGYASDQTAESLPTAPKQASFDDAAPAEEPKAADDASSSSCGCGEEASCGCEPSCGCDGGCSCGCNDGCCLFGDCCLGDAWTLKSCYDPCGSCDHTIAGWVAMAYYDDNDRLSVQPGDLLSFEDYPDHLNLTQAWIYFEKIAATDGCSADWGYRFDMMYGVDAQKTQAFGNDSPVWDVTFDNGVYGWAMPQAYGEIGFNDWSVKIGHFFTPVGYEVIPAIGNFFFSHSYTMFNSEPFTHTGVLGTYSGYEDVTVYAGWTAGWDTGFDQAQGGSNWLGGIGFKPMDDVTVTYVSTAGNFGLRTAGESGYSQSVVAVADLSDKTQYVFQTDWVDANGFYNNPGFDNDEYGINQYLFYTMNDCWKSGVRMEWWKSNAPTGESQSFYEITGGVNYRPHANLVFRPEIRYNWTPGENAANSAYGINDWNNTVFAIDAIATF